MLVYRPKDKIEICRPTAIALGFFDGVHLGHAAVISAATAEAKKAGLDAVVLTFSEHPMGKRVLRLTGDELKLEALAALGVDATVFIDFDQVRNMTPEQFVGEVLVGRYGAQFVACGFNYHFGRGAVAGSEVLRGLCAARGVRTTCVSPVYADDARLCLQPPCPHQAVSSTLIRQLVHAGNVRQANVYLGRPFAVYNEVVSGRQLGRTMGMPTINQRIEPGFVQPRFGVYASFVCMGGERLPAVTNVGLKPTVGSDCLLAETHIFDYDADLYGKMLKVELVEFIRDEVKFDNLRQLQAQMESDRLQAREITASFLSQPPLRSPSLVSPSFSVCGRQTL